MRLRQQNYYSCTAGKYTQFRDYLETKQFHFGKTEIKNGELKEFKLECDKCKRQITLGVD